jgi:pyridoxal biosynthesis lyase PdxS
MKATMEEKEAKKAMRLLLLAYQQQLLEAAEFMRAKGEAIPPNIEEAIAHINNMFGHFL